MAANREIQVRIRHILRSDDADQSILPGRGLTSWKSSSVSAGRDRFRILFLSASPVNGVGPAPLQKGTWRVSELAGPLHVSRNRGESSGQMGDNVRKSLDLGWNAAYQESANQYTGDDE